MPGRNLTNVSISRDCFFVVEAQNNQRKNSTISLSESQQSQLTSLNVFHQNVCGINPKKDLMELYLNGLYNKPHYVCFSEHFLTSSAVNYLSFDDYTLVSHFTRVNKTRGGTLILADKTRRTELLSGWQKLSRVEHFEICGVKDLDTNMHICCCYQNGKNFNGFLERLEQLLQYLFDKKCIICGDFNVDMLTNNKKKKDFLQLLRSYNFRHLVDKKVTFKRNESESCIDNILTNLPDDCVVRTIIDHNGLSDGHAGIQSDFMVENVRPKKKSENVIFIERRAFSKRNQQTFGDYIKKTDWNTLGINNFLKKFMFVFRKSFIKVKKKLNLDKNSKIRWITKGIKVSSKMKRVLYSIDKTHIDQSLIGYRTSYIRIFKRVLKSAKMFTVQNQITQAKNSAKAIWKVVNKRMNKKKVDIKNKLTLKMNQTIVCNPTEIVDIFSNNFNSANFQTAADPTLAANILKSNVNRVENNMVIRATDASEVKAIVKRIESKKSCGYDDLPITIVKSNIDLLAEPLASFYNKCIDQGIFPEQLKIAKIVPLYKKGLKSEPKNYRPISLLPTLSKIFEKIIKIRLTSHLINNHIIHERQFAYQRSIGTSEAIDTIIEDITIKLNANLKVAGVFLDLKSAFDTIDHSILMHKLEFYGIRGNVLNLFLSYLQNRKQFVELKEIDGNAVEVAHRSKCIKTTRGVPQGSVLGPILFVIYLNDFIEYLSKLVPEVKLVIFADDTSAVMSSRTINDLNLKIISLLNSCHTWLCANSLILNSSKTFAMLFKTTAKNKETLSIHINGDMIKPVESLKILGIHLDAFLNWKEELNAIDNSISSACYALRSLRDELKREQLKMVYFALIESKLRYSIKLWGNSYSYNIKRAFTAQKRAIRTIARIPPWESCREHFTRLQILTVPSLYILVLLTDVIKHRRRYETETEMELRESSRTKNLTSTVAPRLAVVAHTARVQSVRLFNKMPTELKLIRNSTLFKNRLKTYLLGKCCYNIHDF
jgi:hypothetical protein